MAFAGVLAGLSFVMSQCGDDNGEDTEPETLAGIYTFTSATLGTELDIGGGQTLPAGTDLTEDFVGAILESSPCTNPEQTAIDLRKSGTTREIYYTCLDNSGTETQQGTWTEASDLSELTLFLTIQGTPFSLKVEILYLCEVSLLLLLLYTILR